MRNTRGFTMIEVLLALAALTVIMATLYVSFSSTIKAMQRAESSLRSLQEARTLLDNLRREIESTLYNPSNNQTFFRFIQKDIYGRPATDLEFTSISYSVRGLFVIAYKTEEVKDGLAIYKRMYPINSRPEDDYWEPLIVDVHSFSVEAFTSQGEPIKSWDSKLNQTVPQEVRITLGIKGFDRVNDEISLTETVILRINRPL